MVSGFSASQTKGVGLAEKNRAAPRLTIFFFLFFSYDFHIKIAVSFSNIFEITGSARSHKNRRDSERLQTRKAYCFVRCVLMRAEACTYPILRTAWHEKRIRAGLRLPPSIPIHKKSRPPFCQANQPRVPTRNMLQSRRV